MVYGAFFVLKDHGIYKKEMINMFVGVEIFAVCIVSEGKSLPLQIGFL